jgi:hypothetical protein
MMRQRKRPEYRIRSFKYWARPVQDLPEAFWVLARQMRDTWNFLVESREKTEELARMLSHKEHRSLWVTHRETCRRIIAESGLNWENGPEVLERFESACRMAARGERGWPRSQCEIWSLMIPHRYGNGGIPAASLFRANRRLTLRPVPLEAYADSKRETVRMRLTRGTFGFPDGSIDFETILHRPIPSNAFVKRTAWIGRRHPIKGWRWFITITVEEPPVIAHKSDKAVAIELGWRALDDAIRVAVMVDQDGLVQDLRLPFDAARSHERRHSIPSGWHDLATLDSRIANLLSSAKAELQELTRPDCCRAQMADPASMPAGMLVRLLDHLDENRIWPEAAAVLRRWKTENDRLRSMKASLSERLIGRRRWIYRNFAAHVCRDYQTIIIKSLPIQRLSLHRTGPDAASRYRQWASPAELNLYIRQAAKHNGAIVKEAESAFSTTTCVECGAQTVQSGNLILTCPNGHKWDQDENSARNLLSQICKDSHQLNYVRAHWPERLQREPPDP